MEVFGEVFGRASEMEHGRDEVNRPQEERREDGLKVELLFAGCVSQGTEGSACTMLSKANKRGSHNGCLSYL
jgi:hypothetical protein